MSLSLQPAQWVGQTWLSKGTSQLSKKFSSPFPDSYRSGVCRSIPQAKPRAQTTSREGWEQKQGKDVLGESKTAMQQQQTN